MKATIILDSKYHLARITTMLIEYPRFLLPQINTHRAFSRNTVSSRALPTAKFEERAVDPFISILANKPGMQGTETVPDSVAHEFRADWKRLAGEAFRFADKWGGVVHKQIVNRALEPYINTKTLITATEWENFFTLRCHDAAQPEMQALAKEMYEAWRASKAVWRRVHIPFITGADPVDLQTRLKLSVARCARLSFGTTERRTMDEELETFHKLHDAKPRHFSPFEHQAFYVNTPGEYAYNLCGWESARYRMDNGWDFVRYQRGV